MIILPRKGLSPVPTHINAHSLEAHPQRVLHVTVAPCVRYGAWGDLWKNGSKERCLIMHTWWFPVFFNSRGDTDHQQGVFLLHQNSFREESNSESHSTISTRPQWHAIGASGSWSISYQELGKRKKRLRLNSLPSRGQARDVVCLEEYIWRVVSFRP